MGDRGLSSRAVLLSLAVAAVGISVALLSLTDSGPIEDSASSAEDPPGEAKDAHASLDVPAESGASRAREPEAAATRSAAQTLKLVVVGIVVEAGSRAAIPDVEIEAFAPAIPGREELRKTTRTDPQGRYSIDLAIPAELAREDAAWRVWVTARGDRFQSVEKALERPNFQPHPTAPEEFRAGLDFEIDLLLAWSGTLVRESDGSPIAGGTATLLHLGESPAVPRQLAEAETDKAGRFLIRAESVEHARLAVLGSAPGLLAKLAPASLDPARAFDVGTIALGEGVCLEGFVTTANGSAPVAQSVQASTMASSDAWWFLRSGAWALRNGSVVPREASGAIGADGRFRVCGLVADEYFLTTSYRGCAKSSRLESLVVRAPATGIRLELSRAVYRLHAFDAASGHAIQRSRFQFDGPEEFACNVAWDMLIVTDPGVESKGKIVAGGYRALPCTLPPLAPCEVRDLEFRLERLPAQFVCTLVVTSPAGAPVVDVDVSIRSATGETDGQGPMPKLTHSEPDGRHELPPLVPGTYHVEIEPFRHGNPSVETWLPAQLVLDVREGMAPVEVRLEEGGLVEATVTRGEGEPVDARTSLVRATGAEPEPVSWRNDAGTFEGWIPKGTLVRLARPLPAGSWTLRFEANGCVSRDVVVDVAAGATRSIAVALELREPR